MASKPGCDLKKRIKQISTNSKDLKSIGEDLKTIQSVSPNIERVSPKYQMCLPRSILPVSNGIEVSLPYVLDVVNVT